LEKLAGAIDWTLLFVITVVIENALHKTGMCRGRHGVFEGNRAPGVSKTLIREKRIKEASVIPSEAEPEELRTVEKGGKVWEKEGSPRKGRGDRGGN